MATHPRGPQVRTPRQRESTPPGSRFGRRRPPPGLSRRWTVFLARPTNRCLTGRDLRGEEDATETETIESETRITISWQEEHNSEISPN